MADLRDLSDEELMTQWNAAGEELAAARDRVEAFSIEHQRRTQLATVEAKAAALSDEDRALLFQQMNPTGVESTSEAGSPGGDE